MAVYICFKPVTLGRPDDKPNPVVMQITELLAVWASLPLRPPPDPGRDRDRLDWQQGKGI